MMRRVGVDVDLCDSSELRKIDPSVNADDVALAAYEPQSGYADPVATTRSFAAAAARHGASFMLRSPVVEVILEGGRATGIRQAGGRPFAADAVCIAAGPWTDRL